MKNFGLFLLKRYLQFGLFFYFERIHVYGLENIPKNKPVLFLCNHQNALIDALLIATRIKGFAYYLTRASVFKKSFVARLLQSFQLIPVYRIRDGYKSLSHNYSVFNSAARLLHQNNSVTIFPEGNHSLLRRVRPLSKGFTRIVFKLFEIHPESDLQLVPIGLNFKNADSYPDRVAIYFGESLKAKQYIKDDKKESIAALKKIVYTKMSQLTTHIPENGYDEILAKLHTIHIDFLNPTQVNNCVANNFKDYEKKPKNKQSWLKIVLNYILILNLLLPYGIWKFLIKPRVTEQEFVSTFRFVIAVTLVPIYLLITGVIISYVFSLSLALLYIMLVLVIQLLAIKL